MEKRKPTLPDIDGISEMSLLEMNNIKFDKRHTILSPELLDSLGKKTVLNVEKEKNNEIAIENQKKIVILHSQTRTWRNW